jgi:ADP-glucose pyrophosphorylase
MLKPCILAEGVACHLHGHRLIGDASEVLLNAWNMALPGMVTDFEEKPSTERLKSLERVSKHATAEDPFEASIGIYMFRREVLERLLGQNENHFGDQAGADTHFGYDVIPHALRDGYRIVAHHHPGYWRVCCHSPCTLSCHPQITRFLLAWSPNSPLSPSSGLAAAHVSSLPFSKIVLCSLYDTCQAARYLTRPSASCIGAVQDVSSLRDFFEVNLELALPGAPISFYEVEEGIIKAGHVLPPALIHECEVENCLIGEGSVLRVGAVCRFTSLLAFAVHTTLPLVSALSLCCPPLPSKVVQTVIREL